MDIFPPKVTKTVRFVFYYFLKEHYIKHAPGGLKRLYKNYFFPKCE